MEGVFALFAFLILVYIFSFKFRKVNEYHKKREVELRDENIKHEVELKNSIKEYFPGYTRESLEEEIKNTIYKILNAYTNYDYDTLNKMCTEELFDKYKIQLDKLKNKNKKNIFSDFEEETIDINNIYESNGTVTLEIWYYSKYYNYIINKNNRVIKGSKKEKYSDSFSMKFIVTKNEGLTLSEDNHLISEDEDYILIKGIM